MSKSVIGGFQKIPKNNHKDSLEDYSKEKSKQKNKHHRDKNKRKEFDTVLEENSNDYFYEDDYDHSY